MELVGLLFGKLRRALVSSIAVGLHVPLLVGGVRFRCWFFVNMRSSVGDISGLNPES